MIEFLLGFVMGIYMGTFYECKPILIKINNIVHKYVKIKNN